MIDILVHMSFSRRGFMRLAATTTCWVMPDGLFGAGAQGQSDFELGLQSWVETLWPSGKTTSGAGRLNVHLEIINKAEGITDYLTLLRAGVQWANNEAKAYGSSQFSQLEEEAREAIVAKAEKADLTSGQGAFFHLTRQDGIEFYYSHRESWPALGFPHPPQPIGFPDHHLAPK